MPDALLRPLATALLLSTLGCGPRPATPATASPAPATTSGAVATASASESKPVDPLASLAWLSGTWVGEDANDLATVEHWLAPEGGTMLGVGRTTMDGRTVFFEYLRIEAEHPGIAYLASPRGQDPPTRFAAVEQGLGSITFENLDHDFPQRIEYRREDDRLHVRISATEPGSPEPAAWSLHRVGP